MMKVVKVPTIYSENIIICSFCFRSSHRRCSIKMLLLEILQKDTCARVNFFIKLRAFGHLEDSGTGVFCKF